MKKTINWLMAMMLLVQLVMPGLVAFAEDEWGIDLGDYQQFKLASGSMCSLGSSGAPDRVNDEVYPDLDTPGAGTYGYYITIQEDKSGGAEKNYIYYRGAENTPINTCADEAVLSLGLLGSRTIKDGDTYGISSFSFTARQLGSAETEDCRFVLETPEMNKDIKLFFTISDGNKDACNLIPGASRNPTSSSKGTCQITLPLDLLTNFNYSPKSFDINAVQLPWIEASNEDGYAVTFFPLTLSNEAVVAINLIGLTENTLLEVDSTIATGLGLIPGWKGDSVGTCGIGTTLPESIPGDGGSCNPRDLIAGLPSLGTALSNFATSLGGVVGNFSGLETNIGDLIAGVQNGTLDPAMLESLVNILTSLNLPDMELLADAFDDLADALNTARPCLSLAGVNVGPTVSALRAVADDFQAMDDAMQALKGALNKIQNGSPANKFCAAGELAEAVADGIDAIIAANEHWTDLSTALGGLGSLPGIGNVGTAILGPVLGQVSQVFGSVVGPMGYVSESLHTLAGYFAKACPIVKNIEATVGASSGLPQDLSGIFADLPVPPNPENLDCDEWVNYKSKVVTYLDGHITSYTALKTRIGQIGGIWSFDADKAIDVIDDVLGVLNQERAVIAGIPTEEICSKAEEVIERYHKVKNLVNNLALPAPTMTVVAPELNEDDLLCELPNNLVFTMDEYDDAHEAWGYLAIVTINNQRQVWVLPGTTGKPLTLPAINNADYTIQLRAIGKGGLRDPSQVFAWLGVDVSKMKWFRITHHASTVLNVVDHIDLHQNIALGQLLLNEVFTTEYTLTLDDCTIPEEPDLPDVCSSVGDPGEVDGNLRGSYPAWYDVKEMYSCVVPEERMLYDCDVKVVDGVVTDGKGVQQYDNEGNPYYKIWECEPIEYCDNYGPESESDILLRKPGAWYGSEQTCIYPEDPDKFTCRVYDGIYTTEFSLSEVAIYPRWVCEPIINDAFCGENAGDDRLIETYGALYGDALRCDKPATYCTLEPIVPEETTPSDETGENYSLSVVKETEYRWECIPPTTGGSGGGRSGGSSGGGGTPQEEVVEETFGADIPTDKCSFADSDYSDAEKAAYQYACENGITTMDPISNARLEDPITRAELAKVLSQYVLNTTDRQPDTDKDCSAFEASIAHYHNDLPNYMKLACQLNIMGVQPDYTPLSDFMPDQYVTRAEFATVFSRILWGNKFEGTDADWYSKHLQALKAAKILTNDDPNLIEKRSWIFLMVHRSVADQAAPVAEVEEETVE